MSFTENYAKDDIFLYMMLDRLRCDCEYFLGFGGRCERSLWACNVENQIEIMHEIWDYLEVKPEWLTKEQIEDYKNQMS